MQQDIFAKRLKKLIEEHSITQNELGNIVGASRQSISLYVNGERTPDIEIAARLADYFHTSVDYLLGRTDVKSPDTDIQSICNYTGLSEEAINYLHNSEEAFVINSILKSVEFDNIVQQISFAVLFKDLLKPNENFKKDFDSIFTKTTKRPAFILLATKQGLAPFYKQQITEEVIKLFDNVVNEIITNDKEGKRSIKFED